MSKIIDILHLSAVCILTKYPPSDKIRKIFDGTVKQRTKKLALLKLKTVKNKILILVDTNHADSNFPISH
jgi:hypothetical protein